jgi:MacB-like periplasmic core domain
MSTNRNEPEQEETRAELAPSIQTKAVDERKPQRTAKPMAGRKSRQSSRTRGFRGIFQSTRSALQALRANALRSLLTSLGIIIGVGAVLIMIAISEGNTAAINQRLSTLNPLQLTIRSGSTSTGGVRGGAGTQQSLTQADADALGQLQGVTAVSPTLNANGQVVFSNQNWSTSVQGVYPSYQQIGSWQLQEGSFFTQSDQQSGTNVVVLGQTVVDNLFTPLGIDPIGQQIRISNQTFTVVGTLASKGSTGFGANADDVVYVPFSTAQQRLSGSQFVNSIVLTADNTGDVNSVQSSAQALFEQRHNISNPANDNFTIQNASQVLSTVQATGTVPDHPAGRRSCCFVVSRRHRHHEYHACFCHRTHARNRHSHRHRGAPARRVVAIPDRGIRLERAGRHHRTDYRPNCRVGGRQHQRLPFSD